MNTKQAAPLEQQIAFSKNIEMCREVLYDLRYADITAYTGLAESTMISYDTRGVSPYITVAKRIADCIAPLLSVCVQMRFISIWKKSCPCRSLLLSVWAVFP